VAIRTFPSVRLCGSFAVVSRGVLAMFSSFLVVFGSFVLLDGSFLSPGELRGPPAVPCRAAR
jgi:hypothetical protein